MVGMPSQFPIPSLTGGSAESATLGDTGYGGVTQNTGGGFWIVSTVLIVGLLGIWALHISKR